MSEHKKSTDVDSGFTPWQKMAIRAELFNKPIPPNPDAPPPEPERDQGRFKKGMSGNPKGRPSDRERARQPDKPFLQIDKQLNEFATQTVPMRRGDSVEPTSIAQAVLQSTLQTAVKGNALAQRTLLQEFRTAEERKLADLARHNQELMQELSQSWERLEDAKKKGLPEPRVVPHPDDLSIGEDGRYIIRGPRYEYELERIEHTVQVRNMMVRQAAMEYRTAPLNQQQGSEWPGQGALLMAEILNLILPKRFQWSDHTMMTLYMREEGKSKRQLLRETMDGYRALGIRAQRGKRLPDLGRMRDLIKMAIAACEKVAKPA